MVNKSIILLTLVAILLRVVLAASTYHPDIQAFNLGGLLVASGQALSMYDVAKDPDSQLRHNSELIYPPAIYTVHGMFRSVFLNLSEALRNNSFLIVTNSTFGNGLFNAHLLMIKLPYLVFDILIGLLLVQLFISKKDRVLVFLLWIFNPVNLYVTYMLGQFDVIAVFFTVLALFFASNNRLGSSALSLGFGAAFKIYPIFLIIPLMTKGKSLLERLKILLLGLLPYIASMLLYLPSEGYRKTALVAGQTLKSLYAQIPVSGGESILLFPLFLGFLYLIFYYNKDKGYDLWKSSLLTLILFYIFTHFHPQWFLWITPFFIIELIKSNFKHWLAASLVLICFTLQLFFFDPSLTVHMFAPLWPGLILQPSLWEIMGLNLDYNMSRSMIQTGLVSALMFYIYTYFPKRSDA